MSPDSVALLPSGPLLWYAGSMKSFLRNISLQQIESLVRLVDEGTFSRAARVMSLTQPSLTKHIQKLEDIVGSRVVERTGGGVELTAEGRVVLDFGRGILRKIDEMEERVSLVSGSEAGTISLAASTIPATYILPAVLTAFRTERPEIRCFVRMNDSGAVVGMVLDGEAEIGILGSCPSNRKLACEPLWKDRLVLVIPGTHPWRGRKSVSWEDVAREPFIAREVGSATRETLERFLRDLKGQDGMSLSIVAEMGSSESVKEAITAGLGISVLSIHAVRRECERGDLVSMPVDGPALEREFYLAYRKQFSAKRHHRLFLDFVRNFTVPLE